MKFYTRRRVSPVITIVSLVDILTMVLMFFVYTTTFKTQQEQVKIVLPTVGSSGEATAESAPVILAVDAKGDVYLDNKPVTLDALGDAVKQLATEKRALQMKAGHGCQLRQGHASARYPEAGRRPERIHSHPAEEIGRGTSPLSA